MAYTTIDDPSAYFKVQLYTGNGSGGHAITFDDTDTTMTPDLVWIKTRSNASNHQLHNSLTAETYHYLETSTTDVLATTNSDALTAFGSDGFTIGSDGVINENTYTYVAWCWKAGTTSGKSTTSETITPSGYSINATSGFGVFTWSGSGSNGTITHGLGGDVSKGMIIVKRLNSTAGWQVYHQGTGATHTIYLNSTAVADDSDTVWNDTAPTSSVFTLGTNAGTNASGGTYVGYVFAPKQGFSKFGSYTGNGNADGPFVYTGFRPAMLFVKNTASGSTNWYMYDDQRLGYNVDNNAIYPNTTAGDQTDDDIDILSNGFKPRNTDAGHNGSGNTIIYAAWAKAPFVNSNGVPCNAR